MGKSNNVKQMDLTYADVVDLEAGCAVSDMVELHRERQIFEQFTKHLWPNFSPRARRAFREFIRRDSESQAIRDHRLEAIQLLDFMNSKRPGKRGFQAVDSNLKFIIARLAEGATYQQCRAVIAIKARQVDAGEFDTKYFRPETLFNATKFASYTGELPNES